jgi:hypothetical protein
VNTHEKIRPKPIHPMAPIATALSVMLLAACSVPVQVPIQTKPQQQPAFIDELKQKLPNSAQQSSVAPRFNPLDDNKLELPVAAPATLPEVVWPARGAGDFETAGAVPAIVPEVVWPDRGAGDFEAAVPAAPIYWYTVGVDERELNPPVSAPASIQAREDLRDRHPSLFESAPAAPQKAGEDAIDRHPSPNVIAPSIGQVVDDDFMGRHTRRPPAAPQKAGEDVHDRHPSLLGAAAANPRADEELRKVHPQLFAGWPRVNLLAIELLSGPEPSPNQTQADDAEPKDDMFYQHPSRNER